MENGSPPAVPRPRRMSLVPQKPPWKIGCGAWCKKYFWEGQALSQEQEAALTELNDDDPFYKVWLVKYRKYIGFLIPASLYHLCWWGLMIENNLFHNFVDKYFMTITMIFGGLVAGMTAVGGGAVAFPVMTLVAKIHPRDASDFSMMIQTSGMSAATFAILFMKVQLEWYTVAIGTFAGVPGFLVGLYCIDPYIAPAAKKMGFVSIFFSFAFAPSLLNCTPKRRSFAFIPDFKLWKGIVLFFTGFIGGMMTGTLGSGMDICVFSIITLLFRVSEKTATSTSVVLMALNSIFGFFWRGAVFQAITAETWAYLSVTFPIVTVMAPFGSILGSHFHRQLLASTIYIITTASLIGAFVVVPQTPALAGGSVGIICLGFAFFFFLTKAGNRVLHGIAEEDLEKSKVNVVTKEILRSRSASLIPTDTAVMNGIGNKGFKKSASFDSAIYIKNDGSGSINRQTIEALNELSKQDLKIHPPIDEEEGIDNEGFENSQNGDINTHM